MGWIVGKKEQEIIKKVLEHLDVMSTELSELRKLIEKYLNHEFDEIEALAEKVRYYEHQADIARREAETMMYSGAFLPNFRGDLLGIIEAADKIGNKGEYVADILELERPVIPDLLNSKFLKLYDICVEAYEALKICIQDLFEDLEKIEQHVLLVEQKEHEADGVERCLIKQIYRLDISNGHKLQLKELVRSIADIADRTEDCSDRVEIVSLKRRV
ncbi:DUF47 domain-containing protein [Pseudothermotoga sp. U03pept]|uniref:DUF47 domain-containing protein n=1 Tax=Pseudothermotoga sp. U03pept TaxID=3447012 RepID=UPI003F0489E6